MPDNGRNLTHILYRRLLGEHPGESAKQSLRHLSWIGASFALAKVISALVNISAGRLLGPTEYGKINVLVSAGTIISPFMLAGIHYSIVKYGAVNEKREDVFGTAFAIFLSLVFLVSAVVILFQTPLSSLFGIDRRTLLLALLYALGTSGFFIVSAMQQSLGVFAKRGLSEISFSLILAAGFFLGIFFLGRVYTAMAAAYIAAFGLVAVFWFSRIKGAIKFSALSRERARPMLEYGSYYFGAGIGSFLVLNVQSIILNLCLSPKDVGVYAAYYTASIGIAGYLGYAANTVIFPKAAASTNRRRLWDMAAKSWKKLFPAAVALLLCAEAAILALMGRHQYGMDPALMALFAVCGTLMLVQSSMSQILFSESIKASRLALFMSLGAGLLNFTLCLVLIPAMKTAGMAVAMILTYTFLLVWLWRSADAYLGRAEDNV